MATDRDTGRHRRGERLADLVATTQLAGLAHLERIGAEQRAPATTELPAVHAGTGPLSSVTVTIEDAVRFTGSNRADVTVMGAGVRGVGRWLWIRWENGKWRRVRPGEWVARYGPGNYGTMTSGAFQRYFRCPRLDGPGTPRAPRRHP